MKSKKLHCILDCSSAQSFTIILHYQGIFELLPIIYFVCILVLKASLICHLINNNRTTYKMVATLKCTFRIKALACPTLEAPHISLVHSPFHSADHTSSKRCLIRADVINNTCEICIRVMSYSFSSYCTCLHIPILNTSRF